MELSRWTVRSLNQQQSKHFIYLHINDQANLHYKCTDNRLLLLYKFRRGGMDLDGMDLALQTK